MIDLLWHSNLGPNDEVNFLDIGVALIILWSGRHRFPEKGAALGIFGSAPENITEGQRCVPKRNQLQRNEIKQYFLVVQGGKERVEYIYIYIGSMRYRKLKTERL